MVSRGEDMTHTALTILVLLIGYASLPSYAEEMYNPFIANECRPILVWVKVPRGDGGELHGWISLCMEENLEPGEVGE